MLSGYVALKGCICAGFVSTDFTCKICSGSGGVGSIEVEDRAGGRGGGGGEEGGGGEGGGGFISFLCHSLNLICIGNNNCFKLFNFVL